MIHSFYFRVKRGTKEEKEYWSWKMLITLNASRGPQLCSLQTFFLSHTNAIHPQPKMLNRSCG